MHSHETPGEEHARHAFEQVQEQEEREVGGEEHNEQPLEQEHDVEADAKTTIPSDEYKRQGTFSRLSRGASERLDRAKILPMIENEKTSCCTVRACLLAVWLGLTIVVIVILSLTLTQQKEFKELEKQYQTEASIQNPCAMQKSASCEVCLGSLTGFNSGCGSWNVQAKRCMMKSCVSEGFSYDKTCGTKSNALDYCCLDRTILDRSSARYDASAACESSKLPVQAPPEFPQVCGSTSSARTFTCPQVGMKNPPPPKNCSEIALGNIYYCCPNTLNSIDENMGNTCYKPTQNGFEQYCIETKLGYCRVCTMENGKDNSCFGLGR